MNGRWNGSSARIWVTSSAPSMRSTALSFTSRTKSLYRRKSRPLGERWHDRGRILVVVGIGVRPRLELAEKAGQNSTGDRRRSVSRDECPGVYAAGDIARWPDSHSGENIRVEHWVVAERQGQSAALNMLATPLPFTAVPFFWSQHYDVPISYVGHAEGWDEIVTEGDVMSKDCVLRFKRNGRVRAVASIFRDLESLETEVLMEARDRRLNCKPKRRRAQEVMCRGRLWMSQQSLH